MIKYLELTAPEGDRFRQVKIISTEIEVGQKIDVGDVLYKVRSGEEVYDLPSVKKGKVIEIIAANEENISLMTPLILLETVIEKEDTNSTKKPKANKKKSKKKAKKKRKSNKEKLEQQSLNLGEDVESANTTEPETREDNEPMNTIAVNVPDIGGDQAKVIEILVEIGETIAAEDSIVTLESDKASMDVPSPAAGKISRIAVSIDDDVEEGRLILELEADAVEQSATEESANIESAANGNTDTDVDSDADTSADNDTDTDANTDTENASAEHSVIEVRVPDIGGDAAEVIEILVSQGQSVSTDDALITLESDKASMDVPSPASGTIESIHIETGVSASEGDLILSLSASDSAQASTPSQEKPETAQATPQTATAPPQPVTLPQVSSETSQKPPSSAKSHASPSVRKFARELGVDLGQVTGNGRKGRITKGNVKEHVKQRLNQGGATTGGATTGSATSTSSDSGTGIPPIPEVDFTQFGEVETQKLSRIKVLTARYVHRSWLNIPHVTHNDESNITELEAFRAQLNAEYKKQNKPIKLSPLAFIVKAIVHALQEYPQFNSSLAASGDHLIMKKYFNIGIAVDTPNGLVVPVIKNANQLSVVEIAQTMGDLAAKARDKKLTGADMSGGCFTISSLGGIGGTNFTPIVNAPEVAILGVSRGKVQPMWDGNEFKPETMLPLSLSYDHRVIDGAEAARFTRHIAVVLEDLRRLTV